VAPLIVGPVVGTAAAVPFAALGGLALALAELFGAHASPLVLMARCVAAGAASGGIIGATVVLLGMGTLTNDTDCWA
jgi:hypothetical protein